MKCILHFTAIYKQNLESEREQVGLGKECMIIRREKWVVIVIVSILLSTPLRAFYG